MKLSLASLSADISADAAMKFFMTVSFLVITDQPRQDGEEPTPGDGETMKRFAGKKTVNFATQRCKKCTVGSWQPDRLARRKTAHGRNRGKVLIW